jgi:hypothetical protein
MIRKVFAGFVLACLILGMIPSTSIAQPSSPAEFEGIIQHKDITISKTEEGYKIGLCNNLWDSELDVFFDGTYQGNIPGGPSWKYFLVTHTVDHVIVSAAAGSYDEGRAWHRYLSEEDWPGTTVMSTPPDPNEYKPKIYLHKNEKWDLSEVYYYVPDPSYGYDDYAGKECYCIEYWFKFNGDGDKRGDDWEPVYVFIDLNGNILYCAATYHYMWDSKDTEADDFENNHVKVYFARDSHTPIIDYDDALGLRGLYFYVDGNPSAYFKECSYSTPSPLTYMKYPHDTRHPFSQERGISLMKEEVHIPTLDEETVLENFPVIGQGGENWCAWASAQMVLEYYGYDATQKTIAEKTYGCGRLEWEDEYLKNPHVFSINAKEFEGDLNNRIISDKLKDIFDTNKYPLSDEVTVTKEEDEWRITTDEEHNNFFVAKAGGELNIHVDLYDCYFKTIRDLSDNSLEIEEITARYEEELFHQIVEAIEDENPIIVNSNGAWLVDIFDYIKHPMGGHMAVIVGYSRSIAFLQHSLRDVVIPPFLWYDTMAAPFPPAIKLHDPATADFVTADFNLGTYWLSYHAFFEKTTKGDDRYLHLWVVKECEKTKPEIDFNVLLKPDKTTYRRGETAQVTIDVTNNRDQDTEIWLGTTFKYPTLKDPEDIPLKRAVIPKGETESFDDIEWTIPADAPLGQYEIAVNCWKDAGQNEYYTDNIVWAPIFTVDLITPDLTPPPSEFDLDTLLAWISDFFGAIIGAISELVTSLQQKPIDVPPEEKARENVENALGALSGMADAYSGFMGLISDLAEVEPPKDAEVKFEYHVLSARFCNSIAEAETYMSSGGIKSADMNDALELVRELELAKTGFCIVIVDYSFIGSGEYESGKYPIVCNEKGDPFWGSWQFYEKIKEELERGL